MALSIAVLNIMDFIITVIQQIISEDLIFFPDNSLNTILRIYLKKYLYIILVFWVNNTNTSTWTKPLAFHQYFFGGKHKYSHLYLNKVVKY